MQTSHFEAITSFLSQNDTFDNRCIQKSIDKKKKNNYNHSCKDMVVMRRLNDKSGKKNKRI